MPVVNGVILLFAPPGRNIYKPLLFAIGVQNTCKNVQQLARTRNEPGKIVSVCQLRY
jgi:hypothetical protein